MTIFDLVIWPIECKGLKYILLHKKQCPALLIAMH